MSSLQDHTFVDEEYTPTILHRPDYLELGAMCQDTHLFKHLARVVIKNMVGADLCSSDIHKLMYASILCTR